MWVLLWPIDEKVEFDQKRLIVASPDQFSWIPHVLAHQNCYCPILFKNFYYFYYFKNRAPFLAQVVGSQRAVWSPLFLGGHGGVVISRAVLISTSVPGSRGAKAVMLSLRMESTWEVVKARVSADERAERLDVYGFLNSPSWSSHTQRSVRQCPLSVSSVGGSRYAES